MKTKKYAVGEWYQNHRIISGQELRDIERRIEEKRRPVEEIEVDTTLKSWREAVNDSWERKQKKERVA